MSDRSDLDAKYFIDRFVYNCPFCNRRNVHYWLVGSVQFDWTDTKPAYGYLVLCTSCEKVSFHLSFEQIPKVHHGSSGDHRIYQFREEHDFDELFFYSVPSSFFVVDARIPARIRELITEAEGCLKMNFLTGASACARKAIYELLEMKRAEGGSYEDRIKTLKAAHPAVDAELFDVLAHIQFMTSDKVHEESWPDWDSNWLRLILSTLQAVLHEIYVVPDKRKKTSAAIMRLREEVAKRKKGKKAPDQAPPDGT